MHLKYFVVPVKEQRDNIFLGSNDLVVVTSLYYVTLQRRKDIGC